MSSLLSQPHFSRISPSLGTIPKSEVFENLRKVESETSTLRKATDNSNGNLFSYIKADYPVDENITSRSAPCVVKSVGNDVIKRTPSPILLKYCKELLEHANILVHPVFIAGEPCLSKEDTELLRKIIKTNESYHYLSENDSNLLKKILELNILEQKISADDLSTKSSDMEVKSEVELLETLLLEEVDAFDEVEFSWEIVEEIFSRRKDNIEEKLSSESVSVTGLSDSGLRASKSPRTGDLTNKDSVVFIGNPCFSSVSVLSEIPEEEVVDTITKISSIPDFENNRLATSLDANIENTDEIVEADVFMLTESEFNRRGENFSFDRQEEIEEKVVGPINILGSNEMDYFYNEIVSEIELPSGGSTPVSPPSLTSLSTSLRPVKQSSLDRPPLSPIPEAASFFSNQGKYSSFTPTGEDLYTDQVFKNSEQKLLDAISAKIAQKPNLPMTLPVKTIKLFDIRRRRQEHYALYIELPRNVAWIYNKVTATGYCEEFVIKHLTFEELVTMGTFYKIDHTTNETNVRRMHVEEIAFNPETLLDILQPPKKPLLPGRLAEKIRASYDSEKYEGILEEDTELDLYSARSESDTECFKSPKPSTNPIDDGIKPNDSNNKRVTFLFDNDAYDQPNLTNRSGISINEAESSMVIDDERHREFAFNSLLEDFYRIDPETILDLYKYLSKSQKIIPYQN